MTEPTLVEPGADPRRRVALLVAAGVAAVVLLLVLLRLATGGGGGEGSPPTTQPPTPRPGATTTTTTTPGAGPRETFEVFATKNPFVPLRSLGGGAAPPGASTPGVPAPGTGAAGGAAGGSTGGAPGGSTEPRRGSRVALQDVFVEGGKVKANVRVNDTVHKVGAGDVFATNFKAVSLSQADRCGRFLFGDDSFRLCRGEEVMK
ncbi:MAG: hypothetical protein M3378_09385 [Actinomycetota bacterium]|nr:hypothetical protein [Actinomycetota bacterium]MDQ3680732.1 hypothetical protein [Actinomycetota bacterium]